MTQSRHSRFGKSTRIARDQNKIKDTKMKVLSQELMSGGYKRQIVRSDGAAAMVSHVRLAILATMADGPYDLIQE